MKEEYPMATYKSDIEIAQSCEMEHILTIAKRAHVDEKYIEQYGNYKAKIDLSLLSETTRPDGKLILVTAITPPLPAKARLPPPSVWRMVCAASART